MLRASARNQLIATLVVVVVGAGACGGSDAAAGACTPTVREPLDPASPVHVVGDGEVEYTSDPPTSGPHQPGPQVGGVVDHPIPRPVQVGILERGDVLLQHAPSLSGQPLADLEALAGDRVVVAPSSDLPDEVVATAWLFKRTCSSVDVDALREFVADHVGRGPDG